MISITPKIRRVFLERIRKDEDDCWIWQGDVIEGEPIIWIDGEAHNAKKIAFLVNDMALPAEPIETHSALDVNPYHHSIKKVKINKYRGIENEDMGRPQSTGHIAVTGDGDGQSTE